MINLVVNLLRDVVVLIVSLALSIFDFALGLLTWLHIEAPRLEGLLIGIMLAWIMARRDSHPLLRVLSAPLKLVVDILDLAWKQLTEVVGDLWDTVKSWVISLFNWVKGKLSSAWGMVLGRLVKVRDLLKKSSNG
jgi:hypothetical protein|tara:strand:+ start:8553 stop:8957 length:405 start_codon:yes stop_codon:yes gene_type:complete